jgi:hypothetical protein
MTMQLTLDRLTLRLTGLSGPDAHRLATLIADRLATAEPPAVGFTADRLRVQVAPVTGESLDAMADRIAAGALDALARLS